MEKLRCFLTHFVLNPRIVCQISHMNRMLILPALVVAFLFGTSAALAGSKNEETNKVLCEWTSFAEDEAHTQAKRSRDRNRGLPSFIILFAAYQ